MFFQLLLLKILQLFTLLYFCSHMGFFFLVSRVRIHGSLSFEPNKVFLKHYTNLCTYIQLWTRQFSKALQQFILPTLTSVHKHPADAVSNSLTFQCALQDFMLSVCIFMPKAFISVGIGMASQWVRQMLLSLPHMHYCYSFTPFT
jgi:hypothetical protein